MPPKPDDPAGGSQGADLVWATGWLRDRGTRPRAAMPPLAAGLCGSAGGSSADKTILFLTKNHPLIPAKA